MHENSNKKPIQMKETLIIIMAACALSMAIVLRKTIIDMVKRRNWINSLRRGDRIYHKLHGSCKVTRPPMGGKICIVDAELNRYEVSNCEIVPPWENKVFNLID